MTRHDFFLRPQLPRRCKQRPEGSQTRPSSHIRLMTLPLCVLMPWWIVGPDRRNRGLHRQPHLVGCVFGVHGLSGVTKTRLGHHEACGLGSARSALWEVELVSSLDAGVGRWEKKRPGAIARASILGGVSCSAPVVGDENDCRGLEPLWPSSAALDRQLHDPLRRLDQGRK